MSNLMTVVHTIPRQSPGRHITSAKRWKTCIQRQARKKCNQRQAREMYVSVVTICCGLISLVIGSKTVRFLWLVKVPQFGLINIRILLYGLRSLVFIFSSFYSQKGQTPLHYAAQNDHSQVVTLFLNHKPGVMMQQNAVRKQ